MWDLLYTKLFYCDLSCGHFFCEQCWQNYISFLILTDQALSGTCPAQSCKVKLPSPFIRQYASTKMVTRHIRSRKIEILFKTKPLLSGVPVLAVTDSRRVLNNNWTFTANVGMSTAFECSEEAHRPLSCENFWNWMNYWGSEYESLEWIINNTKECPKCKVSIEKASICNQVICMSWCQHEFCWLCLRPWIQHNFRTGGYYKCTYYEMNQPS